MGLIGEGPRSTVKPIERSEIPTRRDSREPWCPKSEGRNPKAEIRNPAEAGDAGRGVVVFFTRHGFARGHNWLKLLENVGNGLGPASMSNRVWGVSSVECRGARCEGWNFVPSALDTRHSTLDTGAWTLLNIRRCVLNPADCLAIIRKCFRIFGGAVANAPLAVLAVLVIFTALMIDPALKDENH